MKDTTIEILIDYSGSMGFMNGVAGEENKYLIDGVTRMSLVKKILIEQIIPTIEYSSKLIIRTFRHEQKTVNNKLVNIPNISLIYEGIFDQKQITSVVDALNDPLPGGTPISSAIRQAIIDLEGYNSGDRKIILLTDGEENGDGNYIETIQKAQELNNINCKIFIVGLAQDESSEKKSKMIASGGYFNIKGKSFNDNEIQKILEPLKIAVLKDTITNLQNSKTLNSSERIKDLLKEPINSTTLTIDNEYSEELRLKSETFLYNFLIDKYIDDQVIWVNKTGESNLPYDFKIVNIKQETLLFIDCKGTSQEKPTFYLTPNEWKFFLRQRENYQIYRIFNVDSAMTAFCIENLLEAILTEQVVPYLLAPEILKEERIFLSIMR